MTWQIKFKKNCCIILTTRCHGNNPRWPPNNYLRKLKTPVIASRGMFNDILCMLILCILALVVFAWIWNVWTHLRMGFLRPLYCCYNVSQTLHCKQSIFSRCFQTWTTTVRTRRTVFTSIPQTAPTSSNAPTATPTASPAPLAAFLTRPSPPATTPTTCPRASSLTRAATMVMRHKIIRKVS